jgi:hypothetical protein
METKTCLLLVELATKIATTQQPYLGETKLEVVVLLSRVERDKTSGEIAIPNSPTHTSSNYTN